MQISTKCTTIQKTESPTPTGQAPTLSHPQKLCLVKEVSIALTMTEASFGADQSVPIKHKREHSGPCHCPCASKNDTTETQQQRPSEVNTY